MRVVVVTKSDDVPLKAVNGRPTLVYWNIVGLVQAVRLALVYSSSSSGDDDVVEVRLEPGEPGSPKSGYVWYETKPKLEEACVLPFPNLPYFFEGTAAADGDGDGGGGGIALTQSDTILRYVGRKYDIMGDEGQLHLVDLALDELKDMNNTLVRLCYVQGPVALKDWYEKSVPGILLRWKRLLAGKDYLTGSRVSIADFKLYSFLSTLNVLLIQLKAMNDEDNNNNNNNNGISDRSDLYDNDWNRWIVNYMDRIEQLPKIKDYINSNDCIKRPLWSRHMAKINN